MHGEGTLTWKDGKKYEGEFLNDQREGHGTFSWTDDRKYVGEWKNGMQHGKGIYVTAENTKHGIWEYGKKIQWLKNESN